MIEQPIGESHKSENCHQIGDSASAFVTNLDTRSVSNLVTPLRMAKGKHPNNLKSIMKEFGVGPSAVARAIGTSRQNVARWRNEEQKIPDAALAKLANHFKRSKAAIRFPEGAERRVPVIGYVAAGEAHFGELIEGDVETIEAPPNAPVETVAVEIRGDSLGAGFDRWYALYARRQDPITKDMIGRLCVIGTSDGRTLIKWVRQGQNGFILISGTGAIEEGVTITWAAPVIDLRPRP